MTSLRATEQLYSDPEVIRSLLRRLHELCRDQPERAVMEVCGTHTMAIFRHGVRSLLPPNLRLISGPGCPVCVTPASYLDLAVELARRPEIVITTFGDLVRVPGVGPVSARRISSSRREHSIDSLDQLQQMRVVVKRAVPFLWFKGMMPEDRQLSFLPQMDEEAPQTETSLDLV